MASSRTDPAGVSVLTDGQVRLRAHRAEDIPAIVEQCTDPESVRFTTVPRPYGTTQARDFLDLVGAAWADPTGHRYWAIEAADDPGRFLGTIDLRPIAPGSAAEVGYGLHPSARGRGVMSSALRLVCRWWFDAGGDRVHWRAIRGNFASWRVAWACGFRFHGMVPQSLPTPDSPARDGWQASLGREDPMEPVSPWLEAPRLSAAGSPVLLRAWRDHDIDDIEPPDQPAHHMPQRGVLDRSTFDEWLLTRRERMATGGLLSWALAHADTDRACGEVLLFVPSGTLDDDTAELGYQVVPSSRGAGLAAAGCRLALRHAWAPRRDGGLGLRRLVAQTSADNEASIRTLTRLGFVLWGREPAADRLPGGRTVAAMHWSLGAAGS